MNSFLEQAKQLDGQDPLAHVKSEFYIPSDIIYLDGNSLGPLSYKAKQRAKEVVEEQWGDSLITSWNSHRWIDLPLNVGNKIAPIIGAPNGSVVCCDSISINLFKILSAALVKQHRLSAKRTLIVSQQDNFPTDLYMAQGLSSLLGDKRCELLSVQSDSIAETLVKRGQEIAVLMLTQVNFRNGDIHDIQALTSLAHEHGVLVVWDLAHSAGVMPLKLELWQVDFAIGCTYKYLNGGPGAPAFIYVNPKHLASLSQPLSGWMGHKSPFAFQHDYEKAQGIEQLLCGTPSIISMSVLDAALDIFANIDIDTVRQKSIKLNSFFYDCIKSELNFQELALACVEDVKLRGSQISFAHANAYAICQALIDKGVVADFRAPNLLRIGFSPLFLSFTDIFKAATILTAIMQQHLYDDVKYQSRQTVT